MTDNRNCYPAAATGHPMTACRRYGIVLHSLCPSFGRIGVHGTTFTVTHCVCDTVERAQPHRDDPLLDGAQTNGAPPTMAATSVATISPVTCRGSICWRAGDMHRLGVVRPTDTRPSTEAESDTQLESARRTTAHSHCDPFADVATHPTVVPGFFRATAFCTVAASTRWWNSTNHTAVAARMIANETRSGARRLSHDRSARGVSTGWTVFAGEAGATGPSSAHGAGCGSSGCSSTGARRADAIRAATIPAPTTASARPVFLNLRCPSCALLNSPPGSVLHGCEQSANR